MFAMDAMKRRTKPFDRCTFTAGFIKVSIVSAMDMPASKLNTGPAKQAATACKPCQRVRRMLYVPKMYHDLLLTLLTISGCPARVTAMAVTRSPTQLPQARIVAPRSPSGTFSAMPITSSTVTSPDAATCIHEMLCKNPTPLMNALPLSIL